MTDGRHKKEIWRVVLGAVLIGIAVEGVIQALAFISSQVHHDWMPMFLLVMALFFVVGLWLVFTGLRGKKLSA